MKYRITVGDIASQGSIELADQKLATKVFKTLQRNKSLVSNMESIPEMVTRINLMSGKEYQEEKDTPIYCSPAFESYWSM